jgi:hypothetical protein
LNTTETQQALTLLERLGPAQRSVALRFMEFLLIDPVSRAAATAPPDDEPITDEDRRRLENGRAWFEQHGGKGIPMEEVLADFGLTMDSFPAEPHAPAQD